MKADPVILKTTVNPSVKRRLLFSGTLYSSLGAFALLISGMYMPKALLASWGLAVFLGSLALILIGLRPYRQLSRFERKPDELHLFDHQLIYFCAGKPQLKIPYSDIQKIDHFEKATAYGIIIYLKKNLPTKLPLKGTLKKWFYCSHIKPIELNGLFFPYFNKKAFAQMVKMCKTLQFDSQERST